MAKRRQRRRFSSEEKVAALKRHLVGKEEISAICDELKLHPNQFYEWQRTFFENGTKAFQGKEKSEELRLRTQIGRLENINCRGRIQCSLS